MSHRRNQHEDLAEMRERLLLVRRAELSPPDVHVVLAVLIILGARTGAEGAGVLKEERDVRIKRVGVVRWVPDGH